MNDSIKKKVKAFADYWQGKGYEKGESQPFWLSLLRDVYGVENPEQYISFENQVKLDNTSFIDGYIETTHTMIEQKSLGKNLLQPIKQSDGSRLTPFQQAKRYSAELPYSKRPRWIVTCNFEEFHIYDMEKPNGEPEKLFLKDLPKEYNRLQFLVNTENENIKREMEISLQAGELVGKIYNAVRKQYHNPDDVNSQKSLNKLCVRLVFCLYAEDADIFGKHQMFHDYMKKFSANEFRENLIQLFKILDTEEKDRDKYLDDELLAFPYVNGGLFSDENIEIPRFTDEIIDLILTKASEDFDWSGISPTIFGAVFESTLNSDTRRSGGMHYTSIENIHKVINPLFLDELTAELEEIKLIKVRKIQNERLLAYRNKLASFTFLDPACGSGNFLTETYISLRKLENTALEIQHKGQLLLGGEGKDNPIKVSIGQFYGIEINDFAVTVAKTALWIAESQMMKQTEELMNINLDFLPLKSYANIVEGNALKTDWGEVVPKEKLDYIMGNPPFVGARLMNTVQKNDVLEIFNGVKGNGNLDYVACWYKKASDIMTGTGIRTAVVSTNSITQGEQVAILWKYLFEKGVHIDFAYKTFRWDSEANSKAKVHCVIVGFSKSYNKAEKRLYDTEKSSYKVVKNINGYLVETDDIIISSRSKPICNVPEIVFGSMPNDKKGLLSNYSDEKREEIIKKYPQSEPLFKKFLGAEEFINNKSRWCLWLVNTSPKAIIDIPPIADVIRLVKESREQSTRKGTREQAKTPMLFGEIRQPDKNYIIIPKTSSEKRKYIPMGFMTPDVICGDANFMIPNASLYHFGVLTSNVHMAWVRAVCGRLKSDYRYSKDIVYNNFVWCSPTPEQEKAIEKTAQAILDVRQKYADSSLADMYGENMYLYGDLVTAHQNNDREVMKTYGFWGKIKSESECVAELMKMYQQMTEKE